jgi:hypothetical protein
VLAPRPVKQINSLDDFRAGNYILFETSTTGDPNLGDVSFLLLLEQPSRGFGIQIEPTYFLEISLIGNIYKFRDHKTCGNKDQFVGTKKLGRYTLQIFSLPVVFETTLAGDIN